MEARTPASDGEEIAEQVVTLLRQKALGMKLDTMHWILTMLQTHHFK
jgi:hypothetical protein